MDNNQCGAGGKKMGLWCAIPFLAVAATIFGFEWLFHGKFMMAQYEATKEMWRPVADMQKYFWVNITRIAIMSGIITCLYCCVSKGCESGGCCPVSGMKFGFKIGMLLGIMQWGAYAWMPIPMEMAVQWLIGYAIMGVLIGVVLAFISRFCKKA